MFHINKSILLLAVILQLAFLAGGPGSLFARDPNAGVVDPIDNTVGGEPGEDPHLRHDPDIMYDHENLLGGSVGGTTEGLEIERTRLMGGETAYGGSRVNLVWRTILQHLLWMLHR